MNIEQRLRRASKLFNPECHEAADEIARLNKVIDGLLAHCPDAECTTCSEIVCPLGEPLHFHHDGCPACAMAESQSNG